MAKGKKAEAEVETPAEPKMTQKDAVKQAIAAGADQPTDGVEFVKTKFDIELSNAAFSTLKSLIKKEEGGGKARETSTTPEKRKPGRPPAAPVQAAAARTTGTGGSVNNGSPAELARQVKALVEQHGAQAVREMADVFEG